MSGLTRAVSIGVVAITFAWGPWRATREDLMLIGGETTIREAGRAYFVLIR
jgi:hypothetical protein